jgi:hypothetical protein
MLIRDATSASLLLPLLLAGCETQPPVGPLPVRVSQAATAPAQAAPAASTTPLRTGTGSAIPGPVPAGSGFSLPIGADFPATPDAAAASPRKTTLQIGPLSQQPESGLGPAPGQAPQQGQQTPPRAPAVAAAGSPAPLIHLLAGVAVPQSLPTGTVMAISVDYSLYAELKSSSRYALVVKSTAGEIVSEVKLEPEGNLSVFFQQLKPEHRPFTARIEELTAGSKRRTIVSNEVTLKTDY